MPPDQSVDAEVHVRAHLLRERVQLVPALGLEAAALEPEPHVVVELGLDLIGGAVVASARDVVQDPVAERAAEPQADAVGPRLAAGPG